MSLVIDKNCLIIEYATRDFPLPVAPHSNNAGILIKSHFEYLSNTILFKSAGSSNLSSSIIGLLSLFLISSLYITSFRLLIVSRTGALNSACSSGIKSANFSSIGEAVF